MKLSRLLGQAVRAIDWITPTVGFAQELAGTHHAYNLTDQQMTKLMQLRYPYTMASDTIDGQWTVNVPVDFEQAMMKRLGVKKLR